MDNININIELFVTNEYINNLGLDVALGLGTGLGIKSFLKNIILKYSYFSHT